MVGNTSTGTSARRRRYGGLHNERELAAPEGPVEELPMRGNVGSNRDGSWLPPVAVASLRELTIRHLGGTEASDGDIDRIAAAFATAAHDDEQPPERLLIAVRALWRDFGFSQGDRLQLASLYDRLIRTTIDWYYRD